MNKKNKIVFIAILSLLCICVAALGVMQGYLEGYSRKIAFYGTDDFMEVIAAPKGIYEEMPVYTEYRTSTFGSTAIVSGKTLPELNALCAELSNEYRTLYAYDVKNMFDAEVGGEAAVTYFADSYAIKYLNRNVAEGEFATTSETPSVVIGGYKSKKIKVGDKISVAVRGEDGIEHIIDCIVSGKLDDAAMPLPADIGLTADRYFVQQSMIAILPQTYKEPLNLYSSEIYMVVVQGTPNMKPPAGYYTITLDEEFENNGFNVLPKGDNSLNAETIAYQTYTLNFRWLFIAGGINNGNLIILIVFIIILAFAVVLSLMICKKFGLAPDERYKYYFTLITAILVFPLLACLTAKYSALRLLAVWPSVLYALTAVIICGVTVVIAESIDKKQRARDRIYSEEYET